MGRKKIRPELNKEELGMNPLITEDEHRLKIPVRLIERKVKNKFGEADLKLIFQEGQAYTKVYDAAGAKQKLSELNLRAKEMFLYILYYLEPGCDYIWINRPEYMKANKIKSINTFKDAIYELGMNRYVYPHIKIKDLLWVNPKYFFRGDRIEAFPNNLEFTEADKERIKKINEGVKGKN